MLSPCLLAQVPTPTVGATSPDFSVSVATPPALVQRGESVSLLTIVASLGGFNSPVTLSVQGTLPTGISVTFLPATVTPVSAKPTWPATISSQMEINTGTVVNATAQNSVPLAVRWAALPLVVCLGFARRRQGWRSLLAMALLGLLPLAGGCGLGILPPRSAGGTYVIHLLATASTGQQHEVPLLVRVSE